MKRLFPLLFVALVLVGCGSSSADGGGEKAKEGDYATEPGRPGA